MKFFSLFLCLSLATSQYLAPENCRAEQELPCGPRNTILVIGDGMGMPALGLLLQYFNVRQQSSTLQQFFDNAEKGLLLPSGTNVLVADSACTATAFSTGVETKPGVLGLGPSGEKLHSLLREAKKHGKSFGLVSDTRITHATPAAFYARVMNRDEESSIAEQLAKSDVDVALSGGLGNFQPKDKERNLLDAARQAGFHTVFDLPSLRATSGGKVLGLFARSGMKDGFAEAAIRNDPHRRTPTLRDMTEQALQLLRKNKKGFFLMVEAGQIDWAEHANDAGMLLQEMLKLEDTMKPIYEFAQANSDTLLILTADHETGGFGFHYRPPLIGSSNGTKKEQPKEYFPEFTNIDVLARQRQSLSAVAKDFLQLPATQQSPITLSRLLTQALARPFSLANATNFLREQKSLAPLSPDRKEQFALAIAHTTAAEIGIVWSTNSHTSAPVPLIAFGPWKKHLAKLHSSRSVGEVLLRAMVCQN